MAATAKTTATAATMRPAAAATVAAAAQRLDAEVPGFERKKSVGGRPWAATRLCTLSALEYKVSPRPTGKHPLLPCSVAVAADNAAAVVDAAACCRC